MKLKVLITLLAATCSIDGNCTSQKFFNTSHESALRQTSAGLQGETDEPMSEVIERALTRAHRQAQILADSMERHQKRLFVSSTWRKSTSTCNVSFPTPT